MSTYFVTFRIADATVGGKTYEQRRKAMLDNIRQEQGGFWDETTSFVLIESSMDTNEFARHAGKALSARHDMVVVFDPDDQSAAYFGDVQRPDVLESFLPKLKKVS